MITAFSFSANCPSTSPGRFIDRLRSAGKSSVIHDKPAGEFVYEFRQQNSFTLEEVNRISEEFYADMGLNNERLLVAEHA
jgi:hypothetical protein